MRQHAAVAVEGIVLLAGCTPRIVPGFSNLDTPADQEARLELRAEGGIDPIQWRHEGFPDWLVADCMEGRSHVIHGRPPGRVAGRGMSSWDLSVWAIDGSGKESDAFSGTLVVRRPLELSLDHIICNRVGDPAEIGVLCENYDERVDWHVANAPHGWTGSEQNGQPRCKIGGSMPMGSTTPRTVVFTAKDAAGAQGELEVTLEAAKFNEQFYDNLDKPEEVTILWGGKRKLVSYRVLMKNYKFVHDPRVHPDFTVWVDTGGLRSGDTIQLFDFNPNYSGPIHTVAFRENRETEDGVLELLELFSQTNDPAGLTALEDGSFRVQLNVPEDRKPRVLKAEVTIY